ncbi:MAG: hypothetical protein KC431_13135, partial [Myxococcales bacterium]|nr:hypothetical protein [Myxococcales bacterium]
RGRLAGLLGPVLAPLLMAGALLPLALGPYPLWQRWAWVWAGAFLVQALIMRWVAPASSRLLKLRAEEPRPGLGVRPMPVIGAVVIIALIAAGIWAAPKLDYRSPARLPVVEEALPPAEAALRQHFFDASMLVEAHSEPAADHEAPSPEAAALEAAAEDIARLAALVPADARRIDSPGSFVLPRAELEARKAALAKLGLGERMEALQLLLVDQGLRAEAFSEFIHGAADIEDLPSAQAALDGPLGPWIGGALRQREGGAPAIASQVELAGEDGLPTASFDDERLAALPVLRGPAMAAMLDRRELGDRLGIALVVGLWLTAFLVWLAS